LLVTAFLVLITALYVIITSNLARTSALQLAANYQPLLSITLGDMQRFHGTGNDVFATAVTVTNQSNSAVKLMSLTAFLGYRYRTSEFSEIATPNLLDPPNKVLQSNVGYHKQGLSLDSRRVGVRHDDMRFSVHVSCSDLVGVSKHSFMLDYEGNTIHRFDGPVGRFDAIVAECRIFIQKVQRFVDQGPHRI
jgi:hypothetical protein